MGVMACCAVVCMCVWEGWTVLTSHATAVSAAEVAFACWAAVPVAIFFATLSTEARASLATAGYKVTEISAPLGRYGYPFTAKSSSPSQCTSLALVV